MIYDFFLAPFTEFEFMRRALAGVFALALGAGPIGVFLMLRRMSLVGDAMAHAILPGAAVGFLLWLLYVHHPPPTLAQQWIFLPRLNALLNGLSAFALCAGLYFIKYKNVPAHRASMLAAFGFSSLFLVSYIVNHALRGDTQFPNVGTARRCICQF